MFYLELNICITWKKTIIRFLEAKKRKGKNAVGGIWTFSKNIANGLKYNTLEVVDSVGPSLTI